MKADAQPLNKILSSNAQFVVPFFQRFYSWDRDHWERLANDIQELMKADPQKKHFLGPLVCSLLPASVAPGSTLQYQLIDGQQRLTTLSLLLIAVRDEAKKSGDDRLAEEIAELYLINRFKEKLERLKLVPRLGDRELFVSLIDQKTLLSDGSVRLLLAHAFFRKFVRTHAHKNETYLRGLFDLVVSRLYLVTITLEEEDPYEIFESLNSTGLPLQESDLIRNYLFMQIPLPQQEDFQDDHWAPFESEFDPVAECPTLSATGFYRDFLMRGGQYSKARETFSDFKKYYEASQKSPAESIAELRRFVRFAKMIAYQGAGQSVKIQEVLRQFVAMEVSTAYPVVLNLLEKKESGLLSEELFVGCVADLNSFIFRRSICGESTRTYGVWFCELAGQLDGDTRNKLQAYLHFRGWPDDETFERNLVDFQIYRREFKKCRVMLECLERADGHKELVALGDGGIEIEHVMPQNLPSGEDGKKWRTMLGENFKKDHERWLHTIGNLTLTGYNQPLGNKAFETKRVELKKSRLSLNKIFNDVDHWDAKQILERGKALAKQVAELWVRPSSEIEYVPPTNKKNAAEKHRERRARYWAAMSEMLESSPTTLRPLRQCDGNICDFYLPMADVGLSVRFVPAKHHLTVQLRFSRARGRDIFTELQADRDAIEHCLSVPTAWVQGDKPSITATKTDVFIRERYDWLEHHSWLAETISQFGAAFLARLNLLHESVKEKSASRQALLDYWVAFHGRLFERKTQLLATTPLPQNWNNFAIGRSGVWTYASVNGTESKISVSLIFETAVSPIFFPQLEKEKLAIESEIGSPLDWKSGKALKQWRISQSREGVDVADRINWTDQHDWMIDRLVRFDEVFRHRIQQLSLSERASGNGD